MKRDCPLNVSRPTYGATGSSSVAAPAHTTGSKAQPMGRGMSSRGAQSGMKGQTSGGRGQTRAFMLNPPDVQALNAIVTSTITIYFRQAVVLFDSGATHSFVSPSIFLCLSMEMMC